MCWQISLLWSSHIYSSSFSLQIKKASAEVIPKRWLRQHRAQGDFGPIEPLPSGNYNPRMSGSNCFHLSFPKDLHVSGGWSGVSWLIFFHRHSDVGAVLMMVQANDLKPPLSWFSILGKVSFTCPCFFFFCCSYSFLLPPQSTGAHTTGTSPPTVPLRIASPLPSYGPWRRGGGRWLCWMLQKMQPWSHGEGCLIYICWYGFKISRDGGWWWQWCQKLWGWVFPTSRILKMKLQGFNILLPCVREDMDVIAAGFYHRRVERWQKRAQRQTARAVKRMKRALDVRKVGTCCHESGNRSNKRGELANIILVLISDAVTICI